jgi:hypothetical protein
MVGNSHTISIPKEIFEFIEEQQKTMNENRRRMRGDMDEMVRLAFEDFGRLSVNFFGEEEDYNSNDENEEVENGGRRSRVVKSREIRVVKNGKNLLHTKQTYDSAHPERNRSEVIKHNRVIDELEEEENEEE